MNNIEKLKEKISKIKIELVMSGYLDGWSIKWCEEKLKKLTRELQELEN